MTAGEFTAGDWVDRLAPALRKLAEAQEPWLQEHYRQTHRVLAPDAGQNSNPPVFPLGDVQTLYTRACYAKGSSEEKQYAMPLAVLDPVRGILCSHPTLARVVGRIIGRDAFWMQILGSGRSTSLTDLVAGLMARADELPGERFRAAASELNAAAKEARRAVAASPHGWATALSRCRNGSPARPVRSDAASVPVVPRALRAGAAPTSSGSARPVARTGGTRLPRSRRLTT